MLKTETRTKARSSQTSQYDDLRAKTRSRCRPMLQYNIAHPTVPCRCGASTSPPPTSPTPWGCPPPSGRGSTLDRSAGVRFVFLSLEIVFLQVLVFLLTITPVDKRKNDKITAVLAKEIKLKHRAPVIDIEVTTGHLSLVPPLPPCHDPPPVQVHDAGGLPVSGCQPSYPAPHRYRQDYQMDTAIF